ncbi:SDR family oxidoreductase [Alkalihalobacterium alkalinitrilicum]|uniref:SDR family oxidoreductase n=1 Tax=Alkalihalobacterium alkalinitrilicum TaxID=427920 RepID=UPI0009950EAB|nr:SDR family NAD(P)-dependent oxidoreductase [Alkalihalobacterium alkalinitrilicum]
MELSDRITVITGGARGIGAEIAAELAAEGATLVLTDIIEDELQKTVEDFKGKNVKVEGVTLDVGNEQQVIDAFKYIGEKYGTIEILINNAGISPKVNGKRRSTHEIPLDEWENVLNVNLTGTFLCTRESLPYMQRGGWGRIVNISSLAGRTSGRIAGSHYSASKSGMGGFTRTVASEYGSYGITANCIAPGRIESPMTKTSTEEMNQKFISEIPVGRSGTPKEVASLVSYLCSEKAGYITGTTVDINGGIFMV